MLLAEGRATYANMRNAAAGLLVCDPRTPAPPAQHDSSTAHPQKAAACPRQTRFPSPLECRCSRTQRKQAGASSASYLISCWWVSRQPNIRRDIFLQHVVRHSTTAQCCTADARIEAGRSAVAVRAAAVGRRDAAIHSGQIA